MSERRLFLRLAEPDELLPRCDCVQDLGGGCERCLGPQRTPPRRAWRQAAEMIALAGLWGLICGTFMAAFVVPIAAGVWLLFR